MIRTLQACRGWAAASLRTNTIATTSASTYRAPLASSTPSVMSISSRPAEEAMLKWRFPADDRTQSMVVSVDNGTCQSSILTFNSKVPITADLMEEALINLYYKIESLRICFRMREGQLWVTDMPRHKIDFQVVSGTDLEQEHAELHKVRFDLHNGPLWSARLMPCPPDVPCHLPEIKAAFPHQCNLLLSVHHAANDGIVVLLMAEVLLRIIDSLLEGAPVDSKPIGELRDSVEVRKEEDRIKAALESDPQKLLVALREHSMSKHFPLLMEIYGPKNVTNPETLYLPLNVIDAQVLDKITKKCRSMGTTLNAGLVAVFNTAIVELAKEHGIKRDVYNISSQHPVDSRRLIKDRKDIVLGFHSIPFTQSMPTAHDVKKHFWQYVKHLDAEFRSKLKRNYMCEARVLDALMRSEGFSHDAQCPTRPLPQCDHCFSNIYSPNAPHQGVGKNVHITSAGNYMSVHNERYQIGMALAAFRGQARLQFCYSTTSYTTAEMQEFRSKIFSVLHDIAKAVV